MKTLAEAAAAYCEERERILALNSQIAAIGACEEEELEERDENGVTYPGRDRCTERLLYREPEGGNPWWKATPAEVETFYCEHCRAKVPLWKERRRLKARLAGLMRSMRGAYRRERQHETEVQGVRVNNFDVMKAMAEQNKDIRFAPNILRIQKVEVGG